MLNKLPPLAGPVDASGEPDLWKLANDYWERDTDADAKAFAETPVIWLMDFAKLVLRAAAVPSSPAQEPELPESLAAGIALFREDPTAWWAEWQRKHDFKVKLITENERLKSALPPSSPVADPMYFCERCQMKLPARLMTFGIGVRGGDAAWCAACKPQPGEEGAAKRAEVVALRKAAWIAPGVTKQENP